MRLHLQNYEQTAPDHYTCVPVPGFEKDPAVTAALHEFDSGAIPIWRVQLWRLPNTHKSIRVVNHGIARYYPIPRYLRRPLRVEMPPGTKHSPPNFLDAIFEDDTTLDYKRGGPGGYVPWDWRVYTWCRSQFLQITVENWMRRNLAKRERVERERLALAEDLEARKAELEPWIMRKLEGVSAHGWKQYMDAVWGKNRGKVRLRQAPQEYAILRPPRQEKTYGRVAPAQGASNGNP